MSISNAIVRKMLTCFLAVVFILSALTKAVALKAFAGEVEMYLDLYFCSWLVAYSLPLAGMVCVVELLTGIACMIPALQRTGNVAAFFLLTFFVYLTGDNYFFPSPVGAIESCGCFGELIHFSPLASFLKSLVLWGITVAVMFLTPETIR